MYCQNIADFNLLQKILKKDTTDSKGFLNT